jgi:hypothetical protein
MKVDLQLQLNLMQQLATFNISCNNAHESKWLYSPFSNFFFIVHSSFHSFRFVRKRSIINCASKMLWSEKLFSCSCCTRETLKFHDIINFVSEKLSQFDELSIHGTPSWALKRYPLEFIPQCTSLHHMSWKNFRSFSFSRKCQQFSHNQRSTHSKIVKLEFCDRSGKLWCALLSLN